MQCYYGNHVAGTAPDCPACKRYALRSAPPARRPTDRRLGEPERPRRRYFPGAKTWSR